MNHHFQVNLRGIIDLLSHHLYSGPEVFLRELLQNAVDAIRAREQLQGDFQGEISLELVHPRGDVPATLIVSENGIGLTEEEIHRFLATIGESSKRSLAGKEATDFIGQFGIGLLSCFMVSEEIVVLTRSIRENAAPMEWRGKADGTYTVKVLDSQINTGTQLFLTCKEGCEEFFEFDRLEQLASHFGGLLPYPIRITSGKLSKVINADPPPWRQEFNSLRERTTALLRYGWEVFGEHFFDAIPIQIKNGRIEGVAFVLNSAPGANAKQRHQVYLKNMFLTDEVDNLLPPWAFFVKLIVNVADLKPTASREGFQENKALEKSRDAVGDILRRYLVELSERDPEKLAKLIDIHHLTIKALAVADDDFYRIVFNWLPVETSDGTMTLGEYRRQHDVLRYVPNLDQFRQIARVAAAQNVCVINGGYVYDVDLIEKYSLVFDEGRAERIEARDVTENFADLDGAEEQFIDAFVRLADTILRPFRCSTGVKKFAPADLPTLYTTSPDGTFLRSVEQSKDLANPLWSSMLGGLTPRGTGHQPFARLCFNFDNRLIRQLCSVKDADVLRRSIQMLYVQSLLLGHHPLSAPEMKLLNEGLLGLIELALNSNKEGQ